MSDSSMKPVNSRLWIPIWWTVIAVSCHAAAAGDANLAAEQVRQLTGAHTRVVWAQDHSDRSNDTFARGNRLALMGFDSDDGKGERRILENLANYAKPLFTPKGDRVIYTNRQRNRVYIVNFDGSAHRELLEGFALATWIDPQTAVEWVYVKTGEYEQGYPARRSEEIRRFQIDNLQVNELVWDQTPMDYDNFQLSADGTRASGLFPWPQTGVAELPNGSWRRIGSGCWTSMSPDNSYLFWHFDGPHRNVYIFEPGSSQGRRVDIHQAPGIDGVEVYHPRWSNHPRFLTMTGPYVEGGGGNRIGGGGRRVGVYLGRFNPQITAVEQWVRITHNDRGDFHPDVWISPGESPHGVEAPPPPEPATPPQRITERWPIYTERLVFLWEKGDQTNQIILPDGQRGRSCIAEPRGLARFGRFGEMELSGGAFVAADVNEDLLSAARQSNELAIEAVFRTERLDQGGPARIISFSSGTHSRNFTLGQEAAHLVLRLRTTRTGDNGLNPQVTLAPITAGRNHHVIVTYRQGELVCYMDGRMVLRTADVPGDFGNWSAQHLLFGDEHGGGRDWSGRLEGIAIHSRFIGAEEALERHRAYAQRLESRTEAPRYEVEARLVQLTPIPTPQEIEPYRRGLVVHTYETHRVISGDFQPRRFQVAHWVILDGQPLGRNFRQGRRHTLMLEPFEDHPQLKSERLAIDSDELDLEMFYDVSEPQRQGT